MYATSALSHTPLLSPSYWLCLCLCVYWHMRVYYINSTATGFHRGHAKAACCICQSTTSVVHAVCSAHAGPPHTRGLLPSKERGAERLISSTLSHLASRVFFFSSFGLFYLSFMAVVVGAFTTLHCFVVAFTILYSCPRRVS